MPGVREAIELKRYAEADGEIARVAKALQDEAALADAAAAELENGPCPPRPDRVSAPRAAPLV